MQTCEVDFLTLPHRYTVVPRLAASLSRALPGLMKWLTSAMWTPTCCKRTWIVHQKTRMYSFTDTSTFTNSVFVPRGFHFPALYSAEHRLYLCILEGPRCKLSEASGPPFSSCPAPHTFIYTQLYMCMLSNYRLMDQLMTLTIIYLCSIYVKEKNITSGVMAHGILGRKLSTAWEKA